MSPVHLRNLGMPRKQTEDRKGLFRPRRPGTGHLGNSGLEVYGASSSDPPPLQRSIPMEHGQQEVQPRITLGRAWSKFTDAMSQGDTLQIYYGNSQRMESQQDVQTPGGEGNQHKGNQATIQAIEKQLL
ncbi:hypothetical protein O181_056156 [Austropuccinia psidii MF-1]|uniref:Uncharacterized protein n=1 Tax=Austropuccinia psidii MF-1 TaxID=1389203 RepID=A0A9Q3ECQ5_9BASI|nr:hypothetical protein [Austropuccinia psidii MF-1]